MNKNRRSNIKDRLFESVHSDLQTSGGSSKVQKRVPSAGSRDFKITRNQSPNNSDIRQKKVSSHQQVMVGSNSLQHNLQRGRYEDRSGTEGGNRTVTPSGVFAQQAPGSNIQKKIKDMLASGQMIHGLSLNKSGIGQGTSNSKLNSSNKTAKMVTRKIPSAKIELSSKPLASKDLSAGRPPKHRELDHRGKLFDHQNLIDSSILSAMRKDASRKPTDSDFSKSNINSSTLYQKFSQKIHTNKLRTVRNGFKELGFVRQQSNTLLGAETNTKDANISATQAQAKPAQKKREHAIHRRAESETLKKLTFTPTSQKPSRAHSGKKRPTSQPRTENLIRSLDQSIPAAVSREEKRSTGQTQMHRSYSNKEHKGQPSKPAFSGIASRKAKSILELIRSHEHVLPPFEPAKVIVKEFGRVKAFAVNTHQGIFRNYNEDRVSILLNAQQR